MFGRSAALYRLGDGFAVISVRRDVDEMVALRNDRAGGDVNRVTTTLSWFSEVLGAMERLKSVLKG